MPLFVTLWVIWSAALRSPLVGYFQNCQHKMHAEWGVLPEEIAERVAPTRHAGGYIVAVGTTSLRLLESAAAENGEIRPFARESRLFILPGHRFRAVDMLLTNFHLPRSTLFMLVAALAGIERIKAAYAHAVSAG
jgi:S-adenosylmethionine:tRNA ribosyltransferase-isomerase